MIGVQQVFVLVKIFIVEPFHVVLQLLVGRLLFAALALLLLTFIVKYARKNAPPKLRMWLWMLCIPALFLPFEHSILMLLSKQEFPLIDVQNVNLAMVQVVLAYVWLGGFIVACVKSAVQRKRVLRAIQRRQLDTCAVYSHRFRAHIYVPQNFRTAYRFEEKQMLLAHERQHIRQHDPLLYRILQMVQCIFWFCPFVHKTAKLVRHDRELLCDAKVMQKHPKKDYGLLLLQEAEKAMPQEQMVAGYAPGKDSIQERVGACVLPFKGSKKLVAAVVCVAALLATVGMLGVFGWKMQSRQVFNVRVAGQAVEGAQRFLAYEGDDIIVDESGLYEYLEARGYGAGQIVAMGGIMVTRPSLTTSFAMGASVSVSLEELKTEQVSVSGGVLTAIFKWV